MEARAVCKCVPTQDWIQREFQTIGVLNKEGSKVVLVLTRSATRHPLLASISNHLPWSLFNRDFGFVTVPSMLWWDSLCFEIKVIRAGLPLPSVPVWEFLPCGGRFPKIFLVSLSPVMQKITNPFGEEQEICRRALNIHKLKAL